MQGVAVKDTGFFAGIERFGSFTLAQTENAAAAAAAAITVSSEDSNRASNVTSCDIPRSFPRAESTLFNCNGNLTGRTATLRPGQAMDAIANAEEISRGKLLPSFQDLMASSNPTELARHPNEAEFLSSSSSGIMMGGFFCDPKNISGSHGALSSSETLSALEKYFSASNEDALSAEDLYSCDEFRMFEFKVRRCMRGRSHDWTECPFAHPGEKARRRDPRRFHYSGSACPDFRKGNCKRGDACEFAHGVFECWLHPARYRTQPCKDARNCRRRVCFFAHTPEQLRLGLGGGDGGGSFHRQMSSLKPQANACSCCASFDGNTTIPTVFGDAFDGNATIQTVFGDAFDSSSVSYDRHGCLSHGLFDGSCSRLGGCHTGSPRFTVSARSSFNCANHAGICCVSSQISSPTSTLVGLSPSPPTLSPPLSPTESPPASPEDWRATLTHSLPVAAAAHSAFLYGQLSLDRIPCSQAAIPQLQESSNAATPLPGSIPIASLQLQQIESAMPTLLIPRRLQQAFASAPASPHSCPTKATADLVAALQQMDLNKVGNSIWLQTQPTQPLYSSGPSPLRRSSQSVPSTPSGDLKAGEMWEAEVIEEDEVNLPRVESGRVLRAKIYGKLRKTNRLDSADSPDLGWVNDLVD